MAQPKKQELKEKEAPELPVMKPMAAGMDIGATEIYVAVHRAAARSRSARLPRSPVTFIE